MYFMIFIRFGFLKLYHILVNNLDMIGWREIGANEDNYIERN